MEKVPGRNGHRLSAKFIGFEDEMTIIWVSTMSLVQSRNVHPPNTEAMHVIQTLWKKNVKLKCLSVVVTQPPARLVP